MTKHKLGESVSFKWGDENIHGVVEEFHPKKEGRKEAITVRDNETKLRFYFTDATEIKKNASTT